VKKYLLSLLWVLNFIDAISTHLALQTGKAHEVNPLMRWAYEVSPWFFIWIKLVLGSGIVFLLWNHNTKRTKLVILYLVTLYGVLILWHGYSWLKILEIIK